MYMKCITEKFGRALPICKSYKIKKIKKNVKLTAAHQYWGAPQCSAVDQLKCLITSANAQDIRLFECGPPWPGSVSRVMKKVTKTCVAIKARLLELRVLEHLKHGGEHGQHDQVALHQLATVQGGPLRISDFCLVELINEKWNQMYQETFVTLSSAVCNGKWKKKKNVIYSSRSSVFPSTLLKLPCQSPLLGNTRKY